MLSEGQVRADLREIKYYNSRKELFDKFIADGINSDIVVKMKKYNDAIKSAHIKLYDIYIGLYIRCHTQESLSHDMQYTMDYVQKLNRKLIAFFQETIKE